MAEPRRPQLFFDASALIAGVISAAGAARALLLLSEAGAIEITVSEQVIAETERTLARKAPTALHFYRETLRASRIRIVKDPPTAEVAAVHCTSSTSCAVIDRQNQPVDRRPTMAASAKANHLWRSSATADEFAARSSG